MVCLHYALRLHIENYTLNSSQLHGSWVEKAWWGDVIILARIKTEELTQVTYAAGEFTARTSIEFKIEWKEEAEYVE